MNNEGWFGWAEFGFANIGQDVIRKKKMKKETIEICREKSLKGYTTLQESFTQSDILNKIVEWSKDKNILIYEHLLRVGEENISKTEFCSVCEDTVIPYCERVVYLDIYYQEL